MRSGTPVPVVSFGSAFAFVMSSSAIATAPTFAAWTSGDWPSLSFSRAEAPAATSIETISRWPSAAAYMSAVEPSSKNASSRWRFASAVVSSSVASS